MLLFVFFVAGDGFSQTLKTDVAVAGGTESGFAAAIQSAHSGVKTLFLVETNELIKEFRLNRDTIFQSGIEKDFYVLSLKVRKDTVSGVVAPLTDDIARAVLKGWTDTVKNLTIVRNASWQKVGKSGKDWEIKLKDGRTIKSALVVDASETGTLAARAGIFTDPATGYSRTIIPITQINPLLPYSNRLYRTTVGIAKADNAAPVSIPLGWLIAQSAENFVVAGRVPLYSGPKQLAPGNMSLGQAAGASAAFCAFFKTTTKTLSARIIQGELFAYRSWLLPFDDAGRSDPNFVAIQQVSASGLFKGRVLDKKFLFEPDSLVTIEEMRVPMREFYSRSQLWFADNKGDKFTLGNLLSLIKFAASRGEELNKEVEKAWKSSFKFNSDFDLNRLVTRREFAALANSYLKPFNVQVDMSGNLVN